MIGFIHNWYRLLTKDASNAMVLAIERLMLQFVLLLKLFSTPLTSDFIVLAIIQLMCAKNKFFISEMMMALLLRAFESNLIHIFPFEMTHRLQY